jgi:NTE family protein
MLDKIASVKARSQDRTSATTGPETAYPEGLYERLRKFTVLDDISDAGLKSLLTEADWFSLPGGSQLPREGENNNSVFLVVTGTLGVYVNNPAGPPRLVALAGAGETVGEMSALTGEEHSAALVAMRDSELLRVGPRVFDHLLTHHPRVMFNLLKLVVRRLRQTTRTSAQQTRPKTFALIPLQDGLVGAAIAPQLVEAIRGMGAKVALIDVSAADHPTDWFNRLEAQHDAVFYQGDAADSAWTQFCLRQADRVLLVARADKALPVHPFEPRFLKRGTMAAPELLLLHSRGMRHNLPEAIELRSDLYGAHYHLREGEPGDLDRLARFVAGRAVCLVLAGGGARGFAHIGVLRALQEAKVPFDYVAGTSMGGIVAAGLAMEWSLDEITERMKQVFVDTNPLSDFTLPLIALFRGKKVSTLLQKNFGDTRIEDLARPYFCVSSDLTSGRDYVHRNGLLWRALRASVALPGLLPPVTMDGHLLVDGGVMNNLPVDVMAAEGRGPIIAVDVAGAIDLRAFDERYGERSVWQLIGQRMRGSPSIVSILMRAGTVGSETQRRVVREQADFLFEPPLEGVGMRDWVSYRRAIAQGYAHALLMIEKRGVPLSDTWADGPAVSIVHSVG